MLIHDLGNACGIVQHASCLCVMQQGEQYLRMIQNQCEHILILCRQICLLRTGENLQFRRGLGDAAVVVRQVCKRLDLYLQNKKIQQEFETIGNCTARFDALSLERIVQNLILNAADAMKDGGKLMVQVDGSSEEKYLLIHVEDTGCGMDVRTQKEIFSTHSTKKKDRLVHGLGLPSALRLAKLHGGTISVQSEEGAGSRFSLRIPR